MVRNKKKAKMHQRYCNAIRDSLSLIRIFYPVIDAPSENCLANWLYVREILLLLVALTIEYFFRSISEPIMNSLWHAVLCHN